MTRQVVAAVTSESGELLGAIMADDTTSPGPAVMSPAERARAAVRPSDHLLVAQHVLWNIITSALENGDLWESHGPDIGQDDWETIEDIMGRLVPDPGDTANQAYDRLEAACTAWMAENPDSC
jgi:hypothetical protein